MQSTKAHSTVTIPPFKKKQNPNDPVQKRQLYPFPIPLSNLYGRTVLYDTENRLLLAEIPLCPRFFLLCSWREPTVKAHGVARFPRWRVFIIPDGITIRSIS